MNKNILNNTIRSSIISILGAASRPIETRAFARRLAQRHKTSVYRILGVISGLTRSKQISFVVRTAGGPSYIK